ncbi:MAG: hypothetical protein COU47_02785 [Candidatus Niyogibacteria bacterium CG10_big_fil_rev_8_21_14_0_10_46_36]|uniref:Uncharacterized protein n=1 Tax=Candidatus Niyogibacteria bacterium CG10_big_fil_rev_8_21_14_0_10_46_36 TaxID=1974726 RepID=A0A2H0TD34_9BACT|nr:MAG: hypothetical protein COU47_02785 [Candidatus Niyogibacteria bacterium CG10_big_fil_rev_8_21_14_0_10_46_36]
MKKLLSLAFLLFFSLCFASKSNATAIIGIIGENGTMYMGADDALTAGTAIIRHKNQKIFVLKNGEEGQEPLIIGSSGSARKGQLIEYMPIPKHDPKQSTHQYITITLTEAIKKTLRENNELIIEADGTVRQSGLILVAYKGKLFRIGVAFSVTEQPGYAAIGSGAAYCLGSLETTNYIASLGPAERILLGLRAASARVTTVVPPFHIFIVDSAGVIETHTIKE